MPANKTRLFFFHYETSTAFRIRFGVLCSYSFDLIQLSNVEFQVVRSQIMWLLVDAGLMK